MKFRTTLVLLALFIGLLAFLVLYTLRRPGAAEYKENEGLVFPASELGGNISEQTRSLQLLRGQNEILISRLSTSSQDWRMTKPIVALADVETVSAILAALESLKPLRVVDRGWVRAERLREFGLVPPEQEILFVLLGRAPGLVIGTPTADGKSAYAMCAHEPPESPFIVPRAIRDMARMEVADLRDKWLLRFDPAKADGLTFSAPDAPSLELHRGPTGWEIVAPVSDLVEEREVGTLLEMLSARILTRDSFVDLPPADCGLDKPSFTVAVAEGEKCSLLRIGGVAPDGTKTYAAREGDSGQVLLDSLFAQALRRNPDELRARRALPFRPEEAVALTISGAATMKFERKDGAWILSSSAAPADAERVRLFLRRLSDLEVKDRTDSPAPERLSQAGLAPPRWTVRVETSQTVWELRFGDSVPGGTLVYARRGDSGPILTVPDTVVEMLKLGSLQEGK